MLHDFNREVLSLEIDLSLPAERVVRDQQNRPAADGHDRPLLAVFCPP